jgi:hypothetical protein
LNIRIRVAKETMEGFTPKDLPWLHPGCSNKHFSNSIVIKLEGITRIKRRHFELDVLVVWMTFYPTFESI